MRNKFTNGLFTITDIEYGINDYALVEGYGQALIKYDNDFGTVFEINGIDYPLDKFIRVEGV